MVMQQSGDNAIRNWDRPPSHTSDSPAEIRNPVKEGSFLF